MTNRLTNFRILIAFLIGRFYSDRNVDKKNLAKEVQTTRPILDIYFGEFTYSLALSDSHVNCPSSGDNTKPLAKI